jgi:hypothetical protein
VFEMAKASIARHGCTPGLRRGLKILARQASQSIRGLGAQALRKKIDVVLFGAEVEKPKASRCWSEVVSAAIAAMPPDEAPSWNALLNTLHVGNIPEPSAKWQAGARKILDQIGQFRFDARLVEWFSMLETGGPFGLTTIGSYFMRTLLWYAALQPSSAGVQAVTSILAANWKKTKALQNPLGPLSKVSVACAVLLIKYPPEEVFETFRALDENFGYPESRVRELFLAAARALHREDELQLPDRPNPYIALGASAVQGMVNRIARSLTDPELGDRVEVQREYLIIHGDLDRYRVHRETLVIERMSDGATATADFNRLGDAVERGEVPADATLVAILMIKDEAHHLLRFATRP